MIINKKKYIYSISLILILLFIYAGIKITYNIVVPKDKIVTELKKAFRSNLGKAIKFDSLSIDLLGNIILENFNLSNSVDFNDNISLVKAEEFKISTSLKQLFKGKLVINKISVRNPEVNLVKQYGISYDKMLKNILFCKSMTKKDKSSPFSTDLRFVIDDAEIHYREFFKSRKSHLRFSNVDATVYLKKDIMDFDINGFVINNYQGNLSKGFLGFEGRFFKKNLSKLSIKMNEFNASYLNMFLYEKKIFSHYFSGKLSGNIIVSLKEKKKKKEYLFSGEFNADDLFLKDNADSTSNIITNDNIDLYMKGKFSPDFSNVELSDMRLTNGIAEFTTTINYEKNRQFLLRLKSNSIDLKKLNKKFMPIAFANYDGKISLSSDLRYDLKKSSPDNIKFNVETENCSFIYNRGARVHKFYDCTLGLKIDNKKMTGDFVFKHNNSDFNININTDIDSLYPIKSRSEVCLNSRNVDLAEIFNLITRSMGRIYSRAYIDMNRGYSQMFFRREPEGKFLNDNDFLITCKVNNLTLMERPQLRDLDFAIRLKKGLLRTEQFSLGGLNGKYSFLVSSNLNQDYPFIRIEGTGSNIDLSAINSPGGKMLDGIMNIDLSYTANAYRIGHILQNGKGDISVTVRKGGFYNSEIQKRISDFLIRNEYDGISLKSFNFDNFHFAFRQAGFNCYVRNFSLQSKVVNFSSSGKYSFAQGLSIKLPVRLYNSENSKRDVAPLKVEGDLLGPCLGFSSRKRNDSICFK